MTKPNKRKYAKNVCRFRDAENRLWTVVYLYLKGRLIAEGTTACCPLDIKNGLYDKERGHNIAKARAIEAVNKKATFGRLPGGYLKGAYHGPAKDKGYPPYLGILLGAALAHQESFFGIPGLSFNKPFPDIDLRTTVKQRNEKRKRLSRAMRRCVHP